MCLAGSGHYCEDQTMSSTPPGTVLLTDPPTWATTNSTSRCSKSLCSFLWIPPSRRLQVRSFRRLSMEKNHLFCGALGRTARVHTCMIRRLPPIKITFVFRAEEGRMRRVTFVVRPVSCNRTVHVFLWFLFRPNSLQ